MPLPVFPLIALFKITGDDLSQLMPGLLLPASTLFAIVGEALRQLMPPVNPLALRMTSPSTALTLCPAWTETTLPPCWPSRIVRLSAQSLSERLVSPPSNPP